MSELIQNDKEILTLDKAFQVRKHLKEIYQYTVDEWRQDRQEILDKQFRLSSAKEFLSEEGRVGQLEYINEWGYIGVDIYVVDNDNGNMIISSSLYTQGYNGDKKKNGQIGYRALERIIQILSFKTEFTIYDLAIPNKISIDILEKNGYQLLTDNKYSEIKKSINRTHWNAWNDIIINTDNTEQPAVKMLKQYSRIDDLNITDLEKRDLIPVLKTLKSIAIRNLA